MKLSTKPIPLKRNPNLVPLSKEHHFGLLFCWKLKQGVQKQVSTEMLRSYVRHFWQQQLQEHFEHEDAVLGGLLKENNFMRISMEEEHQQLQGKIAAILSGKMMTQDDFLLLADLLTQHIRFEEREFFPFLEQTLKPEQLQQIGQQLPQQELPADDGFKPEFWTRDYNPEHEWMEETICT